MLLQTVTSGATNCTSKHVEYSSSLSSLPNELPCQYDVTPTSSAVTSSTPADSSVGRSTSLPNVVVCERRDVSNVDPPLRFYSGSLRHKDSILLRKSKLRQVQRSPSGQRLPGDVLKMNDVAVQVIDTPSDDYNSDNFDNRSTLSPRPARLSSNRGVSKLDQGHTGVMVPWTGGTRLPEYEERNCREPASSRRLSRRQCCGNGEAMFRRNSANSVTVILSAVDLPYVSRSTPFYCDCQATLDVRCLPSNGWRCRGVTTSRRVVGSNDGKLRTYPSRMCSRNSELDMTKLYHHEAELSSSSPSPEPFRRHGSNGNDSPMMGNGSQLSGAPVMTSQRRVYALARAYNDRVKNLQRRSATTHHVDEFDSIADLRVHRTRARSASIGRRTALPLSPAVRYT